MPEVFAGSRSYPNRRTRPVLSIGNFDGVHLGHRHLIDRLLARSEERGGPACVYTFEPPPRVVLAPQAHLPRILAWPDKVRLLGEAGVAQVVVERFTRSYAHHPAEWFVEEVLARRIRPTAIVVGYDFRFGRARAGDLSMIRRRLPDVQVEQVDAYLLDGKVVSSSRIRDLVVAGDVGDAAVLLGRPHMLRGTIMGGDKRGRTIGFPTANLDTDGELIPAYGVYAVRVRLADGSEHGGVANLGMRPTFQGRRFQAEVHILDYSGDLYGTEMEIAFIERVRAERRFPDKDALVAQIRADIARALDILASTSSR